MSSKKLLGSVYQNYKEKLVAKNIQLGLANHSLKREMQNYNA